MIALALLGAGAGAGVWLVARAVSARPPPLRHVFAELARPRMPPSSAGRRDVVGEDAARWVAEAMGRLGFDLTRHDQALSLTGRSRDQHALHKVLGVLGGLVGPPLLIGELTAVGLALPVGFGFAVAPAAAVGGFMLPDHLLAEAADRRRRGFRHALSSYLDLVNVILAGGGGIETALYAAAGAGDGWAFSELRRNLDRARLTRRSPWDAFAELGGQLGVAELEELAASVALAGDRGARIRRSLAAKADSLRGHQLAETEAAAKGATERMTIPVAVMLLGFLVFIAYPAVEQITSVSNTPVP